jgi:hypothetical protein
MIQNTAIVCDDFQAAVLTDRVEYKKQKKLRSISSKIPFNTFLLFFILRLLSGLPGVQYIPVTVTGN